MVVRNPKKSGQEPEKTGQLASASQPQISGKILGARSPAPAFLSPLSSSDRHVDQLQDLLELIESIQ